MTFVGHLLVKHFLGSHPSNAASLMQIIPSHSTEAKDPALLGCAGGLCLQWDNPLKVQGLILCFWPTL